MKKTGKVVFGVVSAAALVATGYASWSINKGFTQVSSNPISGTVTEILDNSFGKITLKENDTTLVFDAPKEYYNGTEDLEVSYFVKAHANDGEHVNDYDPYDLTRYDLVSQDYRPYLNISAEITDQNGDPLADEEKLANIEKLIDLPTKVIDYHEWLGEEAKNNEDGYLVNYAITWDKEIFGGVNPQIVYDNDLSLDVVTKREKFQEIIDTLNGVYFKLTFKVGYYGEFPPEVPEEKYGVVTFEEVTNLSLKLTADGNAITSGNKLKVGTTVTVEATPSENYHLVSLTHNGNSILDTRSFKVVENENTIAASVEEDELPPVTTNENTFDKLKDLAADDPATVEGRIITVGYNSVLLYDGTQFGFVNENSRNSITANFNIGDVIKATGVVDDYYGYNYLSIYNAGSVVEASALEIEDPLLTLEPTTWTVEELSNFTSTSEDVGKYVTINNAKISVSGKHTNFSVGDFTTGSVLFDSNSITLENNKTYNLTGVMVYSSGGSNQYKNMMVTSATEVEVSATKVAEVTLNPTTIKVGETATVTAKDDLGNDLTDITVVPVDDTQDIVEVSGTTLKGLKAGEFKFTVTSGELAASDEMTLVVQEETTVVEENIMAVNFNNEPDSFTSTINPSAEIKTYVDRKATYGDYSFDFTSGNFGEIGGATQLNLGTNKGNEADYKKVGKLLSANILSAITETEVLEDNFIVGKNKYYGFFMDANVEQLSRVEFSIKENSDNFAAIHMVASSDGENWEKVVSVNKADLDNLTINYKFENLKSNVRIGFVVESTAFKTRIALNTLNLYK